MSKPRSAAHYRGLLVGVQDAQGDQLSPGMRAIARGFAAKDGFDLRALKRGEWSSNQKRTLTMYAREVAHLTAQTKIIVRTRSPEKLRNAQAAGGHDPKFKRLKVAFLPGTPEATVEWSKDNRPIVKERGYETESALFDQTELAIDGFAEATRAMESLEHNKNDVYVVMAGENLILKAPDGLGGIEVTAAYVAKLQAQYDGERPIPEGSGNAADKPSAHHYSKWLKGVKIFRFDRARNVGPAIHDITQRNAVIRKKREAARKLDYYHRKKRKTLGK